MLATSLPEAQWLERPTGVRKVMGSIPVRDSDFFLSHARDMLNIPFFLKNHERTDKALTVSIVSRRDFFCFSWESVKICLTVGNQAIIAS